MKLGTLLTINAIIAFVFGLGFVLIPEIVLSLYGVSLSDNGIFISRLLGAAFLGFAVVSWLVKNSTGSAELRAIVFALFISEVLGFFISLFYQIRSIVNPLGWTTVAIYLLLGVGFGYFYWKNPSA
jgi:hypothetical protein